MLESGSPEIVEDRNRYLELRRQLSRRTLDSSHSEVSVSTDIMAQLAQEANEREQDLVSKIGPENPNSTSPVRVEEVLSRLKPGELLLDYFSYLRFDLKTMTTAEQRYAAFVLDGTTGSARLIDLGEANPIVTAVDAFRECEKSQSDPANPSLDEDQLATFGQNLRRLVLDPLLPTQFHLNRLYVASDSILGEIPFDALPSAKAADGWHYLVEDTDVIHLSTGRDLARVRSARSTSKEAWLLGDPDFEATPNQRVLEFNKAPDAVSGEIVQARKQGAEKPALMGSFIPSGVEDDTRIPSNWPRLESTALLVSAAAQQAEKAGMTPTILLRAAASEESLSRMISPRFVLISTHGYFVKGEPPVHFEGSIHFDSSDQAISVASRSQMFGEKNANASIVVDNEDFWETFDPLHRSMLILAGANNRVHHEVRYLSRGRLLTEEKLSNQTNPGPRDEREISDGLLTAYKILGLDMTSTELVILAGCESGLGVTSEDRSPGLVHRSAGVMGLRQAFTIAGASSVVTSMWEVPLDQTVDQLQSFMDAWLIHRRARYQAFRESQLAALRAARINGLGGHPFWWGGFVYYGDPGDR
jgi:CHAT domain-containing protein